MMVGRKVWLAMGGAILFGAAGCTRREVEPTPPEPSRPAAEIRPALQYKPAQGAPEAVSEADLLTQALPQLHSRLQIRTIRVTAGKPVSLPMQFEGVLELRAGSLSTIVDGKSQPHQRGEMWHVPKGSITTLQASGELAV